MADGPGGGSDLPRRRVRRLLALIVTVTLSVAYLWVGTAADPPALFRRVSDSWAHAVGYGTLALSALATAVTWGVPAPTLVAGGYAVAHGAVLELAQAFTDTRRAEVRDLLWDAMGVGLAVAGATALRRGRCRC